MDPDTARHDNLTDNEHVNNASEGETKETGTKEAINGHHDDIPDDILNGYDAPSDNEIPNGGLVKDQKKPKRKNSFKKLLSKMTPKLKRKSKKSLSAQSSFDDEDFPTGSRSSTLNRDSIAIDTCNPFKKIAGKDMKQEENTHAFMPTPSSSPANSLPDADHSSPTYHGVELPTPTLDELTVTLSGQLQELQTMMTEQGIPVNEEVTTEEEARQLIRSSEVGSEKMVHKNEEVEEREAGHPVMVRSSPPPPSTDERQLKRLFRTIDSMVCQLVKETTDLRGQLLEQQETVCRLEEKMAFLETNYDKAMLKDEGQFSYYFVRLVPVLVGTTLLLSLMQLKP